MKEISWCWAPTCDARDRPHVHVSDAKGRDVTRDVTQGAAVKAQQFAKELAAGWNGDLHLTQKEQDYLEDEARWAFLRHLNEYVRHFLP